MNFDNDEFQNEISMKNNDHQILVNNQPNFMAPPPAYSSSTNEHMVAPSPVEYNNDFETEFQVGSDFDIGVNLNQQTPIQIQQMSALDRTRAIHSPPVNTRHHINVNNNQNNHNNNNHNNNDWDHDILDCTHRGCNRCVVSCFLCGLCQQCRLHSHTLGERPSSCCSCVPWMWMISTVAISALGVPATFLWSWKVRNSVKNELEIEEHECVTCCLSAFCNSCSVMQMTNTYEARGIDMQIFLDEESLVARPPPPPPQVYMDDEPLHPQDQDQQDVWDL